MKGKHLFAFAPLLITAALLAVPAAGQITINLPKIPKIKKEKPQQPEGNTAPASSPSSPADRPSMRTSDVRGGAAIAGAKVFFSATPFTDSSAGARSSFTSQEFIYGRLELNRSISEAFGLGNLPKRDYYYIRYHVKIGEDDGSSIGPNTGNYFYLSKDDVTKNFINFDVLPDPNKVSTVLAVVDEPWNYKFPPSLASKHDVRSKFPQNGNYPIKVVLFQANFDDYGEPKFDSNPLPYASGQFTFQFSARDAQAISDNYDRSVDSVATAKNKRETLKTFPTWWGQTKAPADAKLAPARMTAMFNSYASQWGRTYQGKYAWDSYSLPLWKVHKNDLGLPSYRFGPTVWAVYKDIKDGMCYFGSHSIREDYSGAGTYGQAYLNTMGDRTYIDCGAVR